MAKSRVTKVAGLYTAPNQLSDVPRGALIEANNVVLTHAGVLEPRRGFGNSYLTGMTTIQSSTFGQISAITDYQNVPAYLVYDESLASAVATRNWVLRTPTSGAIQGVAPPDNTVLRHKFAEMSKNLYITAFDQPRFLTSTGDTTAEEAGVPTPAGPTYPSQISSLSGDPNATGAWLSKDSAVSYRVVVGSYDENKNFKLSAPTPRYIVRNPADVTASLQRVTNVVTATVSSHNFVAGDTLYVTNPSGSFASTANFTITSVTATTIVYSDAGVNAGPTAGYILSSGSKKAAIRIWCDSYDFATSDFYRVYRTTQVAGFASDPGDEHFLVYENHFSTTNLSTNFYVDFTDSVPEAFLQLPLYTNPASGDGIAQSNDRPPVANDLAVWNEKMWYANTKQRAVLDLQIVGVGSPDGFQSGDDLWVAGLKAENATVYTEFNANRNAELTCRSIVHTYNLARFSYSGSATSPAVGTPKNNFPKAYFLPGDVQNGRLLFVQDEITNSENVSASSPWGDLIWYSNRSTCWNRSVPVSGTTLSPTAGNVVVSAPAGVYNTVLITVTVANSLAAGDYVVLDSTITTAGTYRFAPGIFKVASASGSAFTYYDMNRSTGVTSATSNAGGTYYRLTAAEFARHSRNVEAYSNRLYYSKIGEPEAVPRANFVDVGSQSKAILRIIATDQQLFVFKEDGLFSISGDEPYIVNEVDLTCICLAPDTVVKLDNAVWAWTSRGVVVITSGGLQVVSDPIKDRLQDLAQGSAVRRGAFAYGSETDRRYYLYTPLQKLSSSSDYIPTNGAALAYVYNIDAGGWASQTTHVTKATNYVNVYASSTSDSNRPGSVADIVSCGHVMPLSSDTTYGDRILLGTTAYSGNRTSPRILIERKTLNSYAGGFPYLADYIEGYVSSWETVGTTSASSTRELSPLSNAFGQSNIPVGSYAGRQSAPSSLPETLPNAANFLITAATTPGPNTTVTSTGATFTGTASVSYAFWGPIPISIRFAPDYGDAPEDLKQFSAVQFLFQKRQVYNPEATFESDFATTLTTPDLIFADRSAGYVDSNGDPIDIADPRPLNNKRVLVSNTQQQCSYLIVGLRMGQAFGYFQLAGYTLQYTNVSFDSNR